MRVEGENLDVDTADTEICVSHGCENRPMVGYVFCVTCLHGHPAKASQEAIKAKKKRKK